MIFTSVLSIDRSEFLLSGDMKKINGVEVQKIRSRRLGDVRNKQMNWLDVHVDIVFVGAIN